MALFSRRPKASNAAPTDVAEVVDAVEEVDEASKVEQISAEEVPNVSISMQTFRGVGAHTAVVPEPAAPAAPAPAKLPLAPADPPAQTESVPGMKDNVLLREALAQLGDAPSNEELIGVLRQSLQGNLYLRVQGDAQQQLSAGQPLSIAIARDGDHQFMLAFSSAGAVKTAVLLETDPTATSAVVQPVRSVFQQVVDGPFAGLVLDTASAPNRVIFPSELIKKALDQADASMTLKSLIATPRDESSATRVGEALTTARLWVAVADAEQDGQFGIAEAQLADGTRLLQLFSHPLEIVAMGRGERPMPFTGEQVGNVLAGHPELDGVLIDPAGPTIVVRREALAPVIALAKPAAE